MTARLDLISDSPRNAETRLAALLEPVTPTADFYVRSNFPTPVLRADDHELEIRAAGEVRRLTLRELKSIAPTIRRVVTLECAGNGRTLLRPQPDGTPWTLGAAGTAIFTGIPLAAVLPGDLGDAVELVFTGADHGRQDGWGEIPFQRSLPLGALDDPHAPMLAWAMNDAPLTPEHGAPLRLVVPGWYAVASVKWLSRVEAVARPFEGYFQTDRYRYLRPDGSVTPVRRMRVRSLLLAVGDVVLGDDGGTPAAIEVDGGATRLRGAAWSGHAEVERVAVSLDGGETWRDAEIERDIERDVAESAAESGPDTAPASAVRAERCPSAWVAWALDVELAPGDREIAVRARDAAGHEQPMEPWSNELGYGNNVVQRVPLSVR